MLEIAFPNLKNVIKHNFVDISALQARYIADCLRRQFGIKNPSCLCISRQKQEGFIFTRYTLFLRFL